MKLKYSEGKTNYLDDFSRVQHTCERLETIRKRKPELTLGELIVKASERTKLPLDSYTDKGILDIFEEIVNN